jgi:peptidoglycan hydrolase-like protein with peptidoglycan-binding domain
MLQQGDRGDEVKALQESLADAGFDPGPIDGIFGPKTAAAVKGFQESEDLQVDGIAGPNTMGALGKAKGKQSISGAGDVAKPSEKAAFRAKLRESGAAASPADDEDEGGPTPV